MTTPKSQGAPGRKPKKEKPKTAMEAMGGPTGLVYTGLPVLVFTIVNSTSGLTPAIWVSIGVALAICVLRLVRKEALQPAISGLFAVAVASFVAWKTGSAKGFFLIGIWMSLGYAAVTLISVLVRWPAVGALWNLLSEKGTAWRRDKPSLHAYDIATLTLTAVFVARFVVQYWLYDSDQTGFLAFARIAMGYPLFALASLASLWAIRKSSKRLKQNHGPVAKPGQVLPFGG